MAPNEVETAYPENIRALTSLRFFGALAVFIYHLHLVTTIPRTAATLLLYKGFLGVDFFFIDVTDKAGRKTRFYVSSKSYRVMMIDYEDDGVKYRRKFYNYNYAQGTLVPFRSTLSANDKIVEESEILTVTYGQKIDEELFRISQG